MHVYSLWLQRFRGLVATQTIVAVRVEMVPPSARDLSSVLVRVATHRKTTIELPLINSIASKKKRDGIKNTAETGKADFH